MPNRILRESILTSDRMASLGWPEEVFYRRLMSVVDDYGRFDGRPEILRARLYPLQLDMVSNADVAKWTRICAEAGLVSEYTVEGKPYIEVLRFGQSVRSASKYPACPARKCAQVRADAPVFVSVSECGSVSESVSPLPPANGGNGSPAGHGGGRRITRAEKKAIAAEQAEQARLRKLEEDRIKREQMREGTVPFSQAKAKGLIKPLKPAAGKDTPCPTQETDAA